MNGNEVLGWWVGELAKGCELCMEGLKVVIFVTGTCPVNCFYCPTSYDRRDIDAFYVDEEPLRDYTLLLDEISLIDAKGISITGGEPLSAIERVYEIIKLVKEVYGSSFHVHLYTSGYYASKDVIRYLDRLGLDEIRFHPISDHTWKLVEYAVRETSMDVGIEIPALPNLTYLKSVVLRAAEIGVKFVNMNELEVSETNALDVTLRGFVVKDDGRSVVGSKESALRILEWVEESGLDISVRFCPAVFKDVVQHRKRLLRKAVNCVEVGDQLLSDGTIVRREVEYLPLFPICMERFRGDYDERL